MSALRILDRDDLLRFIAGKQLRLGEAEAVVRPILDDVRSRGDAARLEHQNFALAPPRLIEQCEGNHRAFAGPRGRLQHDGPCLA